MSTQSPSAPADTPQDTRVIEDLTAPETPQADAVREAAIAKRKGDKAIEKLDDQTVIDATEWFLSDEPEQIPTRSIELNVGVGKDKWVRWTVRALDRDRIRDLRKMGSNRAGRRAGAEGDEMRVNLLIATEGSVIDWDNPKALTYRAPDGQEHRFVDAADAMRYRFRHKPGLIDQIAGEVLSASGYDDDDVREVAAAGS